MLQEGLPACFFSPCNSGAVCDSSRKTSHHVRGCWMSLLPGSTCVLQPLSRGDPSSAALSRAEDKSTRLLSYGSDTHVLRPAAGSAGGLADPPPPGFPTGAQRSDPSCAAQPRWPLHTWNASLGGPTTAWLCTKMAPIKSFPFRSAIAHVEGRMIWVLSCGQQIPELSLEPKHAPVALQMPPGIC